MLEKRENVFVLPIQDATLLPGIKIHIMLGHRDRVWRDTLESGQPICIALPMKSSKHADEGWEPEDFHTYGVAFRDFELTETDRGTLLSFRAGERVKASELVIDGRIVYATLTPAPEVHDLDGRMQDQMLGYIRDIVHSISARFHGGEEFNKLVDDIPTVNQMIAWLSRYMPLLTADDRYELLKTDSMRERSLRFLDALLKQRESVDWNIQLNERVNEKNNKFYREQVLKEQLKAIKEELGDSKTDRHSEESYLKRIEEADLPDYVREAAEEEVEKLAMQQQGGSEKAVIQNYLDFILALPWKREEPAPFSLEQAREILESRHYGLDKIKKRVIQHLAVLQLKKDNKGSILLFAGPPGTGKTSLGKSIADALGRKYIRMSLGGVRDESEIRGHRRTYVGAMAGRILTTIKKAGVTNPVIVLDEVDKLQAGGYSGDPAAALLEVLDPEQNDTFTDHYLDLPYDLSDVFFIATANSIETVPKPLLDRMEIIEVSGYTPDEKFHIAKEHLLAETLEEHGLDETQLIVEDALLTKIISDYTREAGVRGLKKRLAAIARTASEKVVEGKESLPWKPREDELDDALGRKVSRHETAGEMNPPGVVTGLAWTPVGGEILFIEATNMPGSGETILTGQLGDVMKESARISLSLLRSRLPLGAVDFKKSDLHIHVPAGSTPKDGPSAGIALFTALASLMTGRSVDSRLAMTGEITLRGQVMPIGGVKEKLLGAQRAGIRKVLLPMENKDDMKDVPAEVKETIEVIFVETIEDVLREALGINIPKLEQMVALHASRMQPAALLTE